MQLASTLAAWGTPAFEATLKAEIAQLGAGALPLQQGLSGSSYALDGDVSVMLISARAETDRIFARLGVFYAGIIAGCSCADDPTPVDEAREYCEVWLEIDRASARARVTLAQD